MTTSALSVSLFIVCSSWVSGGGVTVPPPLLHGALAVDKPRTGSGLPYTLGMVGIACSSLFGDLPKTAQTCLIRHHKIGEREACARAARENSR